MAAQKAKRRASAAARAGTPPAPDSGEGKPDEVKAAEKKAESKRTGADEYEIRSHGH